MKQKEGIMAKVKQWHQKGYCILTHHGWVCESTFTFAKGRIKRMRNTKKIREDFRGNSIRLNSAKDKFKIWDFLWHQNQEFTFPITRWNRH